jgi:hypothetical protein
MHSDASPRHQSALEYSVGSIKEHISGELLLATFEIRKDSHVHILEIDYHILQFL